MLEYVRCFFIIINFISRNQIILKANDFISKETEKTPMNDQLSSFYSEKTQERDHFYEKFFIG